MAWLLAHMWAALAGFAVFGLFLGWSIRGMLLVGKMRRAVVERDVTQTELEQAREEIESLYAAQRGQPVGSANAREAQAEQTVKIQRLTDELSRARSELDALKAKADEIAASGGVSAGGAAAAGAAAGTLAAVGGATDPNPALVWRNRHLESRVRHLESLVGEGGAAAAPAPAEQPAAPVAEAASEAEAAKAEWQENFLKQRVEALEAELAKVKAQPAEAAGRAGNGEAEEELARLRWRNRFLEGRLAYFEGDPDAREEAASEDAASEDTASVLTEPAAEAEPEDPAPTVDPVAAIMEETPDTEETPDADAGIEAEAAEEAPAEDEADVGEEEDDAAPEDMDEPSLPEAPVELAADPDAEVDLPAFEIQDRFADEIPAGDDAPEDEAPEVASAEEASRAILAALELNDDEDEYEDEDEADAEEDEDEADLEADADPDDAEEAFDEDEEADMPAGVRPIALDKPVADTPDDLTEIGGIGPKIQELLNEMGVWHYDQIAAWSPENVIWVDQELNFNGRIVREGWVQQAAVLAGDTVDEDA